MAPRSPADEKRAAAMAAAQRGDQDAYAMLLRQCVPIIRMLARQWRVPSESVDDLIQDVLFSVHRVRHTFDATRSFDAWLSAIARRRMIDALRRRFRSAAHEIAAPATMESYPSPNGSPEWIHEMNAAARLLREAISRLPLAQREAVELLALGEYRLAEAALVAGKTQVAMKVNLHRAMKTLRSLLAGRI